MLLSAVLVIVCIFVFRTGCQLGNKNVAGTDRVRGVCRKGDVQSGAGLARKWLGHG